MNKLTLYLSFLFLFMILSFSLDQNQGFANPRNTQSTFRKLILDNTGTVILDEAYEVGVILNSYLIDVTLWDGSKPPEKLTFSISKKLWKKLIPIKGKSIFSKFRDGTYSAQPILAGFNYVNHPAYGKWNVIDQKNSLWVFHKPYQDFPKLFNWKTETLTQLDYLNEKSNITNLPPYDQLDEHNPKTRLSLMSISYASKRFKKVVKRLFSFYPLIVPPSNEASKL